MSALALFEFLCLLFKCFPLLLLPRRKFDKRGSELALDNDLDRRFVDKPPLPLRLIEFLLFILCFCKRCMLASKSVSIFAIILNLGIFL